MKAVRMRKRSQYEEERTMSRVVRDSTQREGSSQPTIEPPREEEQAPKNQGIESPPPQSTPSGKMAMRAIAMGRKLILLFFLTSIVFL